MCNQPTLFILYNTPYSPWTKSLLYFISEGLMAINVLRSQNNRSSRGVYYIKTKALKQKLPYPHICCQCFLTEAFNRIKMQKKRGASFTHFFSLRHKGRCKSISFKEILLGKNPTCPSFLFLQETQNLDLLKEMELDLTFNISNKQV